MSSLSFKELAIANDRRLFTTQKYRVCLDWSLSDWGCALAGEAGEACNLIKKLRVGETISYSQIAKELADVVIYADLIAMKLGIDLGEAVRAKFNEVSDRVGSDVKL